MLQNLLEKNVFTVDIFLNAFKKFSVSARVVSCISKYSPKPFLLKGPCLVVECKLEPVFLWFEQIQGLSTTWIYSHQIPQTPYFR